MVIGYLLDDTLDVSDGVQQAVINIGEHMRSLGHEVHYLTPKSERTDLDNVHSLGKLFSLKFNGNSVRTPYNIDKYAVDRLFDDVTFDVVHVQSPYSPVFSGRILKIAKQRNVKILSTFHILPYNTIAKYGLLFVRPLMLRSLRLIDTHISVSEPAREYSTFALGVESEVVPNPVNYAFFDSHKRKKQDKTSIVYVGRFDERKGVKQLISANVVSVK